MAVGCSVPAVINPSLVSRPPQTADAEFASASVRLAVASCTRKIFPDTLPVGPSHARLVGAKKEYLSFQILMRADSATTLPLHCTMPGVSIFEIRWVATPGVALWGYPEDYMEHRRTVYPDPLVPVERIILPRDETRCLWVRVCAGATMESAIQIGDYRVPFSVEVLPWTMPDAPSLTTGIGLGGRGFARYYGLTLHSEEYWALYEKYYLDLLDYRLTGFRPPYGLSDERGKAFLMNPRVTSFISDYSSNREIQRALCEEYAARGVAKKAWIYNVDEPETLEQYDVVRNQIAYLATVCPGLRYGLPFYTGAADKSTPFDHLSGLVTPWIIQTDYYAHGHGLGDKVRRQARQRWEAGDEIWLYTALAPRGGWCNILLNHTALEHRLLFWQLYAEEISSGYLFWQSTYWDEIEDPWTDQATVKKLDPNLWGDGSLFYPGADGPVASIRLELIRAGLQDYELLKQAEARLGREVVMAHVKQLTTDFTHYTDDPNRFEAIRGQLQRLLASSLDRDSALHKPEATL
jgi:hypothetical protein